MAQTSRGCAHIRKNTQGQGPAMANTLGAESGRPQQQQLSSAPREAVAAARQAAAAVLAAATTSGREH